MCTAFRKIFIRIESGTLQKRTLVILYRMMHSSFRGQMRINSFWKSWYTGNVPHPFAGCIQIQGRIPVHSPLRVTGTHKKRISVNSHKTLCVHPVGAWHVFRRKPWIGSFVLWASNIQIISTIKRFLHEWVFMANCLRN